MMWFVLLGCSPYLHYQNHLRGKLQSKGFQHEVIKEDGRHISYWIKEKGNKVPIVMVHGFGGSGMMTWNRVIATVSEDRPVILPDLLWFGESRSSHRASLQEQSKSLSIILEKENILVILYQRYNTHALFA